MPEHSPKSPETQSPVHRNLPKKGLARSSSQQSLPGTSPTNNDLRHGFANVGHDYGKISPHHRGGFEQMIAESQRQKLPFMFSNEPKHILNLNNHMQNSPQQKPLLGNSTNGNFDTNNYQRQFGTIETETQGSRNKDLLGLRKSPQFHDKSQQEHFTTVEATRERAPYNQHQGNQPGKFHAQRTQEESGGYLALNQARHENRSHNHNGKVHQTHARTNTGQLSDSNQQVNDNGRKLRGNPLQFVPSFPGHL